MAVARRPVAASLVLVISAQMMMPRAAFAGGGGGGGGAVPEEAIFRWIISDQVGSGLVEVDVDGHRVSHTVFSPFGNVVQLKGTQSGRSIYGGHEVEATTGLVYMNARWYDPVSGRFMSVDPVIDLRTPQAHNAYSYVSNNPVNAVDPTGAAGSGTASDERVPPASEAWNVETMHITMSICGRNCDTSAAGPYGSSGLTGVSTRNHQVDDGYIGYEMMGVAGKDPWAGVETMEVNGTRRTSNQASGIPSDFNPNDPGATQGFLHLPDQGGIWYHLLLTYLGMKVGRWAFGRVFGQSQILKASDKQIGRKFGQHRDPGRPGYRTYDEYRRRANEVLNNPNARVTRFPENSPKYPGETHYQVGDDLLRLDRAGEFRSLYPVD